jgi:hypothetical protein
MIDALGFKGIWKRPGVVDRPEVVIEKLVGLQDAATRHLDSQFGGSDRRSRLEHDLANGFELVNASFLSDTIVLALAIKDQRKMIQPILQGSGLRLVADIEPYPLVAKAIAVFVACRLASAIVAMGARTEPSLAYRGCISFGDFEVRDRFLIGPAVDEAAAANNLAQGAFVWLLPSAREVFGFYAEPSTDHPDYVRTYSPYEVPLKGGETYDTFAVSPYLLADTEAARDEITSRILLTFSGGLDVQLKKQHTRRFLDVCEARWKPPIRPDPLGQPAPAAPSGPNPAGPK